MAVGQLRRAVLAEQAVAELQKQLTAGEWPVGERLPPEQQLAEQLGVGRSTVREALRALANAGWVESRQGAGTFVLTHSAPATDLATTLRRAHMIEVYEVRQGLELQAARLAAVRRTDADLERMDEALMRRKRALSAGRMPAYVDADLDFHRAVVTSAHNSVLSDVFASFSAALRTTLTSLTEDSAVGRASHAIHVALADALRAGDPEVAAAATLDHLSGTQARLRRLVDAR